MPNLTDLTPEPIEQLLLLSATIDIFASSSEGIEDMILEIDGVAVATFEDISKDGAIYTHQSDEAVTADQVRVRFTNDFYEPGEIDTNLIVDRIAINGRTFETEHVSTYSTGTWTGSAGVIPGNWQSEWLHVAGYFQYADTTSDASGSIIDVIARGDEGGEQFRVLLNERVVASFSATEDFRTYSATLGQTYNASTDSIRVEHFNSQFDPDEGIDQNLQLDKIVVDNRVFEAESPTTISTGTWIEGPPNERPQSEWLHLNGYMEFGNAAAVSGPALEVIARGDEGLEDFRVTVNGVQVAAFRASTDWTTYEIQLEDYDQASDIIRIEHYGTQYDAETGIDYNLYVDRISINRVNFETEHPLTLSVGNQVDADGTISEDADPVAAYSEALYANGYFEYNPLAGTPVVDEEPSQPPTTQSESPASGDDDANDDDDNDDDDNDDDSDDGWSDTLVLASNWNPFRLLNNLFMPI